MIEKRFIITSILDWFVPDSVLDSLAARMRAHVLVGAALTLICFCVASIAFYANAKDVLLWSNVIHLIFAILLLVAFRVSGKTSLVGGGLVFIIYTQLSVTAFFTGGLNSNIIGMLVFVPVLGMMINGYLFAIFCAILYFLPIGLFQFFDLDQFYFLPYDINPLLAQRERSAYLVLVTVGLISVSLFLRTRLLMTIESQKTEAKENRRLLKKINDFVAQIGQISSSVTSSSEQLSANAAQVQEKAVEISTCESQAAASIFQSTNTIHELSTSFQETVGQMKELESLAISAQDEGLFGGEGVVKSNLALMNIEKSSQRIEGIIQVITEIAEQTNLLSLNAAIEADKAGDYGKGFAVVAEEVGSLAKRSNEAAEKIIQLIRSSNEIMLEEKKVIDESGQILEEIINEINKITSSVHEIVINIKEQDAAIQEVAKGCDLISRVSEKDVEIAENLVDSIVLSNRAIENLNRIADSIELSVTRYKDRI